MTKEEYQTQLTALTNQIEALKLEYIVTNQQFIVGEKVEGFYNEKSEGFGRVMQCYVQYNNEIGYIIRKLKKDGTLSERQFHSYNKFQKVQP